MASFTYSGEVHAAAIAQFLADRSYGLEDVELTKQFLEFFQLGIVDQQQFPEVGLW